jgi:hypothetical protein
MRHITARVGWQLTDMLLFPNVTNPCSFSVHLAQLCQEVLKVLIALLKVATIQP